MQKITCISDLHRQQNFIKLTKGNVLVIAGDYDILGNLEQCVSLTYGFMEWIEEVKKKFNHIILIAGNHDIGLEHYPIKGMLTRIQNCYYLQNSGITIDGVKYWGSPITPTFMDWAFMKDRGTQLKRHWTMIPEDTEVLITHGPAFGILDKCPNGSLGDQDLLNRIKELPNLKAHIFGHIHESYGKVKKGKITFVNASVLNGNYVMTNKPIRISI